MYGADTYLGPCALLPGIDVKTGAAGFTVSSTFIASAGAGRLVLTGAVRHDVSGRGLHYEELGAN